MLLNYLKIKGYLDELNGFLIKKGDLWSLYDNNPTDFVLDGKFFVQNKFILNKKGRVDDYDFIKEQVYLLKVNRKKDLFNDIDLNSTLAIFNFFKSNQNIKLVGIQIKKENVMYIGRISKVCEKSVYIQLLSVNAKWLKVENFRYDEIRLVFIDTDYLDSLVMYLKYNNKI